MDLPPRFRHNLRYGNVLQPPHFIPHHLPPPPPPPPPPHILFPPPPLQPPPRHDTHFPVSSRLSFSPPYHSILERSHIYEFDHPAQKPYFDCYLPPPPPPPPQENLPFRLIHDYPESNPMFEDEILRQKCNDICIHDLSQNWDQNLHWVAREVNHRVSDIEHRGRYNNVSDIEIRELYNERNDDVRRWNYGINGGRELYIERDDDVKRWNYGINGGRELYIERDDDVRRWNYGINGGRELYIERDDDERRCVYGINDGISVQLENRGREFVESNFGLGRFSGRLTREGGEVEFVRSKKTRRVQKKSALHRIQLGKARRKHGRGLNILKKLSSGSFKGKEKEGFECLETRMKDKREREQSPMELSISFKSNSLVAKAILVPSSPAVNADMILTPRNRNIVKINSRADSPLAKSSKDMAVTEHGLNFQSGLRGTRIELPEKFTVSENGSVTAKDANDLGDNAAENKPLKDMNSQGFNNVGSGRRLGHRLRKQRTLRTDRKQLLHGTSLQMTKDSGEIVYSNTCISSPSELNTNSTLSKVDMSYACIDMVPDVVLLPSLGRVISEKVDINGDSSKPSDFKLKRKRSSLNTLPASLHMADHVRTDCPGHSGRVVSTTEDSDCASKLGTDEVTVHANGSFLADENTGHGDSLGQHADNVNICVHSLASIPDVGVRGPSNAEEIRTLEGATVADWSNVSLAPATSSNFLSVNHKGIVAESDISFHDTSIKQSCNDGANLPKKIGYIGRSPEAINHAKTCLSIDYSSKIKRKRKRKARGAQMSIGSNFNVLADMVGPIDGELASLLPKDLLSAEEVDFPGERDNCEEECRLNEEPFGDEDSPQDGVDFFADGSFPSYRKKRKVVSPRLTLSSLSADDSVGDGLASHCSKLDQVSPKLPELRADQREDTPSDTLADGNKLHVKDDLVFTPNTLSMCVDGNGVCATKSGDELIASGFDIPSCTSSPEYLLSYSDLCFLRDTKASLNQSENEMIFGRLKASNVKPVSGDSKAFSLTKSIENSPSDHMRTNAEASLSLPQDSSKMVRELSLVHGKLPSSKNQLTSAGPKVFPGHPALNYNTSRKFPSTHVSKSRTWHRTGNSSVAVDGPKLQSCPLPHSHATKTARTFQSSYIRKGNSLVRKPSSSGVTPPKHRTSSFSVYRLSPCIDSLKKSQAFDIKIDAIDAPCILSMEQVNTSERPEALPLNHIGKSLNCASSHSGASLPVASPIRNGCPTKTLYALEETVKSSAIPECQTGSGNNSDCQSTLDKGNLGKKIMYVKRSSNQLVAASDPKDPSIPGLDKSQASLSDGYYKKRKNQLIRASLESHVKKGDAMVNLNSHRLGSQTIFPRSSGKRQSSKGFAKTYRASKFSFVWKLHDAQLSDKNSNSLVPQKVWPYLFPWKKASHRRSFIHALGSKPNNSSLSTISQKLLLSSKRDAIYKRSTHGYSLRISKVLSVGGSSLKWSKSIERNSKKANEEATQAVVAAEKRKKEEKGAIPVVLKSRNHVYRKSVLSVKLRPGERIFRVGSERYKMDPTRRTLHRITAEEEPSTSVPQSEKNVKRSYVPRRLLIGNDEYVQIGNGNQLVRDPKKRTRVLASEKVRWSLRTARLRLARKRKYCQFFTRFGKCNKSDGKCPYIHDRSKIVVCTKFLNGLCTDPDCKLTHKVIPERMQDCSYFLKGSCSNENCPYRHVNVNPDSSICERFLRGYCADGNECRKKHTYVCPAFETTGICPQYSTCKLHHPKKKTERKPTSEQKNVRGRYFDGGLIDVADCSVATSEILPANGKDDIVCEEGKFPDYISLDLSDEEVEN